MSDGTQPLKKGQKYLHGVCPKCQVAVAVPLLFDPIAGTNSMLCPKCGTEFPARMEMPS